MISRLMFINSIQNLQRLQCLLYHFEGNLKTLLILFDGQQENQSVQYEAVEFVELSVKSNHFEKSGQVG